MTRVISADQAIAQGSTPGQLERDAQWHDERADAIGRALKRSNGKTARLFGDVVSDHDRQRHISIAADLRAVASEVGARSAALAGIVAE